MDRPIEKKPWYLKHKIKLIVGLVIFGFVFIQFAFGDYSSKFKIEKEKVTIREVNNDYFRDYISVTGTVEPKKIIYLDAVEGGRVEIVKREEGSKLKIGDTIVVLSNNNLLLEISNNEAQVARAVNELRTARIQMQQNKLALDREIIELDLLLKQQTRLYNNNLKFIKQKLISEEEFRTSKDYYQASTKKMVLLIENAKNDSIFRKVQIKSLEESTGRLEKNLVLVRNRLDNLTVKSPANGELADINPKEGEVITYGTRIGKINILDAYKLRLDIDEYYISKVKKGLFGNCLFSGKEYEGKIVKIYTEVRNGKFMVDMEFTGEIPGDIKIGGTSRIKIELGESEKALIVSKGSFYQSTGGQWVCVVDETGNFAVKRNIKIGKQNPKYYEITDGLIEGEKIISSGYDNFGDVDKIVFKQK